MTEIKTKIVELPTFEQLTSEEQEKVIYNYRDINVDYNWWTDEYEDAKEIGLILDGFDLDRNRHATGEFDNCADDCARLIVQTHGASCETYLTAKNHLDTVADFLRDKDAEEFEDELAEIDADFKRAILEEYSIILQNQYEYLTSDEAIKERLICNDYTFNRETLKIDS